MNIHFFLIIAFLRKITFTAVFSPSILVRPFRGGRIHRFGANSTRAATDIHIPFIPQGGGASSPGRCPGLPSPAALKACLHW